MYLFDSTTQIAAVQGQAWSLSAFVTLVAGDNTGLTAFQLRMDERNSGGTSTGSQTTSLLGIAAGTLGTSRFQTNRTLTSGTTAFISGGLYVSYSNGATIDITFRVAREQMEQDPGTGSSPTSPIRTTAGAVTRSADVVSAPVYVPGGGISMTATGFPTQQNTFVNAQYIMSVDDGTTNNYFGIGRRQGNDVVQSFSSAGPHPAIATVWTQNTNATIGLSAVNSSGTLTFTGQSPVTDTTAGFPAGFNTIHIGCTADGTSQWNGYITEMTLGPVS
jgi:hypothetical protein